MSEQTVTGNGYGFSVLGLRCMTTYLRDKMAFSTSPEQVVATDFPFKKHSGE